MWLLLLKSVLCVWTSFLYIMLLKFVSGPRTQQTYHLYSILPIYIVFWFLAQKDVYFNFELRNVLFNLSLILQSLYSTNMDIESMIFHTYFGRNLLLFNFFFFCIGLNIHVKSLGHKECTIILLPYFQLINKNFLNNSTLSFTLLTSVAYNIIVYYVIELP